MKWSTTFAASHCCLTVIKQQQVRWYGPKCISTAKLVTGAAHNTGWRIVLAESTLCWLQHLSDGRRWKCCMCVFVCVRCMHESVYVNILEFGSQFTNCDSGMSWHAAVFNTQITFSTSDKTISSSFARLTSKRENKFKACLPVFSSYFPATLDVT